MRRRDLFRDEAGLTTVGMVLALLVTLSLIFSAGQVLRVNAAASEIQNVADAAALAAQNEVAEFMIVARACDAVVLSLSLTSLAATGLGIAALCVPPCAPAGDALLRAGRQVAKARDAFAENAAAGLNRLQRLLPFFAAANAASVAAANNGSFSLYVALAILSPVKGEDIAIGAAEGLADAQEAAERDAEEIRQAAEEAERAAEQANEAKMRAFERDCGANPAYCMYERASTLAFLDGADNPLYKSVDTWSFSVALKRAQMYYPRRAAIEAPENSSVEAGAQSAVRARFYAFAAEEVGRGYVHETDDSFDALFPHLPKNTAEMRSTKLYTEAVYPCSTDEEGQMVMHAWSGCPNAQGSGVLGSIAQMESGGYPACDRCEFSAGSMGNVAAASTSIENGFEYHYAAVARAADDYERAREELEPLSAAVKSRVSNLFDLMGEALRQVAGKRIHAQPPGRLGAVVLVANVGQMVAAQGFASSFVRGSHTLGARAAVSAATLVAEPANEGSNVISSMLDGLSEGGGAAVGVVGVLLDCWSGMLQAYTKGQSALDHALAAGLDGLPLGGASGLGTWAAGALRGVVSTVGLEPANLDALKPVLVNSAHVAGAGTDEFSAQLLSLKQRAIAYPLASNDLFTSIAGALGDAAIEGIASFEGKIQIAVIEVLGEGGPSIPIEITLPPAIKNAALDVVDRVVEGVKSVYAQVTGVRVWE